MKTTVRENYQTDHMDHSLVSLNETMSQAVWDQPRLIGHGGQF